jgi:hypothetical protein
MDGNLLQDLFIYLSIYWRHLEYNLLAIQDLKRYVLSLSCLVLSFLVLGGAECVQLKAWVEQRGFEVIRTERSLEGLGSKAEGLSRVLKRQKS